MAARDTRTEAVAQAAVEEDHLAQATDNTVDFDEKQLAEESIAGCTQAFEELYAYYYPRVKGFCLRKTGNPALAEDIAQEAFARAFERITEFGGPKHFGGWVGTIAANLCTDHFRRKRNTEVSLDTDSDRGPAYEVDPIRNIQRQDTSRLVRLALERLDPRQREALLLHEVKGMTCAAVGDQLGISEVAAESLLARARRRLRKEITAKAAPADLFGLGGLGLLPTMARAWRRLKDGAGRRASDLHAAAGRTLDGAGINLIPGVDGAKALVVVMGAALTVQVASAAAPPKLEAPTAVPTAAVAEDASSQALMAADGDTSNARDRAVEIPVSGYVDPSTQNAGFAAEGALGVDEAAGREGHTGLNFNVQTNVGADGANVYARVFVLDESGSAVADTGDVELDTQD